MPDHYPAQLRREFNQDKRVLKFRPSGYASKIGPAFSEQMLASAEANNTRVLAIRGRSPLDFEVKFGVYELSLWLGLRVWPFQWPTNGSPYFAHNCVRNNNGYVNLHVTASALEWDRLARSEKHRIHEIMDSLEPDPDAPPEFVPGCDISTLTFAKARPELPPRHGNLRFVLSSGCAMPVFILDRDIPNYGAILPSRLTKGVLEVNGWIPPADLLRYGTRILCSRYDEAARKERLTEWVFLPEYSSRFHPIISLLEQCAGFDEARLLADGYLSVL